MSDNNKPTPSAPAEHRPLLPTAFYNTLNLFWVSVLPLLVLLAINGQGIWIAYGEMTAKQKCFANYAVASNAGMVVLLAGLGFVLWRNKKNLNSWWSLLLFALHAGFVWLQFYLMGEALPFSVPNWILDRDILFLAQLACPMAGCFYSLLGLACYELRVSRLRDVLYSGGMMLGVPVFWFLLLQIVIHIHRFPEPNIYVLVTFFILSTAVMCIGLLRLLVYLHNWLKQYEGALVLLSALLMPLGGLCLNRAIPFPVSFQVTGIYVLTVVNAIVLLLGCLNRFRSNPWLWLAAAATFPFTLYFFVVFLPFLPFFLPGIMAIGAGFLVVTPTVLFMVHGQKLLSGYAEARKQWGAYRSVAALLAALLLLPGWFVTQAMLDRQAVRVGLDYVYSPQLQPRQTFKGNPRRVCDTLEHLRSFKERLYLPILSNLYNWAVFDNLSLPDAKIEEVYETFAGTKIPPPAMDPANNLAIDLFETNRQAHRGAVRRPLQLPREKVVVESHQTSETVEGDCVRQTVVLRIKNTAGVANEFVGEFEIPDEVMISGYWLHIGQERVPGRLFEKKTALWVYEQIRDQSRRDPGILRYTGPNTVEMRVYPLAQSEVRTAEVEFIYPRNMHPQIALNHEPLLPKVQEKVIAVSEVQLPQGQSVLLVDGAVEGLPRTPQKAYLHFIVDRSLAAAKQSPADLTARLKELKAMPEFSGITQYKVTLANYESNVLTPRPVLWSGVESAVSAAVLDAHPVRGGFAPVKALKEEMLEYEAAMDVARPDSFSVYPVFVVMGGQTPGADEAMSFLRKTGGYPVYWNATADKKPVLVWGPPVGQEAVRKALVLAAGNQVRVFPDIFPTRTWREFVSGAGPLQVFDPGVGAFGREVPVVSVENSTYRSGAELLALQQEMYRSPYKTPGLLPEVVRLGKKSGLMSPATSYIVVENSAQWKILQLKERQKLGAHEAMELEETPEPSVWLLLALFLPMLALWRWWRTKNTLIPA